MLAGEDRERLGAALGRRPPSTLPRSSSAVSAKMLRKSSSTISTVGAGRRRRCRRRRRPRSLDGQRPCCPVGTAGRHDRRRRAHGARSRPVHRPTGSSGRYTRERAADARLARERDLAPEQAHEVPADRQAEAGAAVLARRRAVGLGERLEHRRLQLLLDADPGVADADREHAVGVREPLVGRVPARPARARSAARRSPCSVNLNAFESRFLSTWRRRWGSVTIDAGKRLVELDREAAAPAPRRPGSKLCTMLSLSSREHELAELELHCVRLDLGEVEDVVQQLQQVAARGADHARVLHLALGEVAVRVVLELLGEHEQAVQRRAQLVRHVRDELGLVLRRDGELGRLLLDEPLGLLHLLVLALDLAVLVGEQRRLLRRGPRSTGAAAPAATAAPGPASCACSSSFSVTESR